ncbi:MAG: VOC family protein [Planctomycetota bacterium]|jgi:catechol 2,3-dioxygenase-like lactoylglutathione lyase family enzyme
MTLATSIKEAHPIYYVADLKRTESFYTDTLGLEKAWFFEPNILGVKVLPGFLLVFCEDPTKIRAKEQPAVVFAVEDVDGLYAELKGKGVVFQGPPQDRPYGRIASFTDPDGYAFDLCG